MRQTSWGTHAVDGWYVRPAMGHYHCGTFWVTTTQAIRIVATSKLFPTNWTIPTVSEEDETIMAAAELAKVLGAATLLSTQLKIRHAQVLQQLTNIIKNLPPLRVDSTTPTRVGAPTTSRNATLQG